MLALRSNQLTCKINILIIKRFPHGECCLALGYDLHPMTCKLNLHPMTCNLWNFVPLWVGECCGRCAQHTPLMPN